MSTDRNKETREAVKRELKEIQARCLHTWNVIDNSPLDAPNVSLQQINEKTLCYIEGLRTELQNTDTPITADDNLLTSLFLKENVQKTTQVEEFTAYTRGSIHDLDTEINRLKTLINIAQEARTRPKTNKREVKPVAIHKAKERFQEMKTELNSMIYTMFSESAPMIVETLGQLMQAAITNEGDGYLPITTENYKTIEILKDMKIVKANPYNNTEIKLAFA